MRVSEIIVRILEREGITDAFGIPGAGINPVYKYLGLSKIKHYTVRHEEAAVHAADGYYRACGRMAVAMCTSGPGATNFVTGVYTANVDSIPILAITGQAVTAQLGKDAFQCVDIAKICEPVAKATFCVTDASKIVEVMQKAFMLAKSGKPGAVVVDLPLDVQMAEIDFNPDEYQPLPYDNPRPNLADIQKTIAMINEAENPAIIMGGGVILAEAADFCVKFAEMLQIPVITTYMAKGGIPVDHPLNAGHAGIQVGQPVGNKVFTDSDLILGIGCRFTDRHTGNINVYKGNRKFIHINVEPKEIGKIFQPDLGIVADAKYALEALLKVAASEGKVKISSRVASLPQLRTELKRKTDYNCVPIKPQRVYEELNKSFKDNAMFTTGCGLNQIWSGQLQNIDETGLYFPSGGAGTLGFDIPAAFGAKVANPDKHAVAVMGDFGFTFHVQELATSATYGVPIIVVIVNNAFLGLIRQNQKYAYSFEHAVKMEVNQGVMDYVKVAEGFACAAERVFNPEDITGALARAANSKIPYVIDIVCELETDCSMGLAVDSVREFV
ncbi:glyoxylate carboligase [Anaerosporomusa subterranea]|uniref:Glyoxylate carboligase n=1 Tax=Anaerosporomusa subterranea TaxID=1794912 RepID=A0A154BN73_ANASB|nr:thiamine pyrophosphate-binding protein [Anaerosporomusa subterranea]KYZ75300.1 glyoxylate carboligase [Anaerosporomusa subterranea]